MQMYGKTVMLSMLYPHVYPYKIWNRLRNIVSLQRLSMGQAFFDIFTIHTLREHSL